MTVARLHSFSLDEAALSGGAAILSAGSGLPRRIGMDGRGPSTLLSLTPRFFWRVLSATTPYGYDEMGGTFIPWLVTPPYAATNFHPFWKAGVLYAANSGANNFRGSGLVGLVPNTATPFTIGCWQYVPATSGNWFASAHEGITSTAYQGVSIGYENNYLSVRVQGATGSVLVRHAAVTGWVHWVLTYDGSGTAAGVKLYVNGSLRAPTVVTNNLTVHGTSSSSPHWFGIAPIGWTNTAIPTYSYQAEWFGFARALTEDEVLSFATGKGSRARWAVPFNAPVTVKGVMLPGSLANSTVATLTRAYLSTDGGATRSEVIPGAVVDVPVGAGQSVTLDADLSVTPTALLPFLADSLGGGPTLIYEEADPPPVIISVPAGELSMEVLDRSTISMTIEDRTDLEMEIQDVTA